MLLALLLALTGVGALADQVAMGDIVHLVGKTAPWAEVVVIDPVSVAGEDRTVAVAEIEASGEFDFSFKITTENLDDLQITAVDDVGVTNRVTVGEVVGGEVVLPPTIVNDDADTSTDSVALMGMSYPNAEITLTLIRNNDEESTFEIMGKADGYWSFKNSDLKAGKYTATAKSTIGAIESDLSQEIYFEILPLVIPPEITEVVDQVFEALLIPEGVKKMLLEEPEAVARVLAPVAAVPVIGFWLKDLIALLLKLFLGILHFFGWRKERRRFGIVYDSVTKKPLERSIVRLYQVMNDNLVMKETEVTGTSGEFAFLPASGRYKITVTRAGYVFPSAIVKARNRDGEYLNLYHGEIFEIQEGQEMEISVPMDQETAKIDWKFRLKQILGQLWRVFGWLMLVVGVVFAVRSVLLNASILNVSVVVFYAGLIIWNLFNGIRVFRSTSVALDEESKRGLMGVSVAVYEVEFNRLVQRRVSDKKGRFLLLLPQGRYRLEISALGYEWNKGLSGGYKGDVIEVKGGTKVVRVKIWMKRK